MRFEQGRELTERSDRIPSQEFLKDTLYVLEVFKVFGSRQSIRSNDTRDLLLPSPLNLGMQRHHEEEVCDGGDNGIGAATIQGSDGDLDHVFHVLVTRLEVRKALGSERMNSFALGLWREEYDR